MARSPLGKPPKFVPKKQWDRYSRIVQNFLDHDAATKLIVWFRHTDQPALWGEGYSQHRPYWLEILSGYNYFRQWPINQGTKTGTTDQESVVLWVSKKYMVENGFMDDEDYVDLRQEDRFYMDGKLYRPTGDTYTAQAGSEDICWFVVVKRDDYSRVRKLPTGPHSGFNYDLDFGLGGKESQPNLELELIQNQIM